MRVPIFLFPIRFSLFIADFCCRLVLRRARRQDLVQIPQVRAPRLRFWHNFCLWFLARGSVLSGVGQILRSLIVCELLQVTVGIILKLSDQKF
jgi:hypothetical protein